MDSIHKDLFNSESPLILVRGVDLFTGAINEIVRSFLGNCASDLSEKTIVIGCSGNFTSEAVLTQLAKGAQLHSNDVSFYSCLLGEYLTGNKLPFTIVDEDYSWLEEYRISSISEVSAIAVLLDMLQYGSRKTLHSKRMWQGYKDNFPGLVEKTIAKIEAADVKVASFYPADVREHFERFAKDENAVFMCYAPTYAGGYERLYKQLEAIVEWSPPSYPMLSDARRDDLIQFMKERQYLWYDDRILPGDPPIMEQRSGRSKTVYLYSNILEKKAFFGDLVTKGLPLWPLVNKESVFTPQSRIEVRPIRTTELSLYKDAYLGKNILHGSGTWAFAVMVDGKIAGFLEYARSKFGGTDGVYLFSDFAVTGSIYKHLSKLIINLGVSADMKRRLERLMCYRVRTLSTTAFTDRAESMKYRGVLKLVKRGETKDGQKFLNYDGVFNEMTDKATYKQWLQKQG